MENIKDVIKDLDESIDNCEYTMVLCDVAINHCSKIKSKNFIKVATELKYSCDRIQKGKFDYYFRNYLGYNLGDLEHVMIDRKSVV